MERPAANLTVVAQRWTPAELAAVIEQPVLVDDPMLTVAQAAALLGITQGGVDRLVRHGLLPRRGPQRGRWQYRLSDLERIDVPASDLTDRTGGSGRGRGLRRRTGSHWGRPRGWSGCR
jgi:hypothetical protein